MEVSPTNSTHLGYSNVTSYQTQAIPLKPGIYFDVWLLNHSFGSKVEPRPGTTLEYLIIPLPPIKSQRWEAFSP